MANYDKRLHSVDVITARLVDYYASLGKHHMLKQEIAQAIGVSASAVSRIVSVSDQNRYSVRHLVILAQAFSEDGLYVEPGYLIPSISSFERVDKLGGEKALKVIFPEHSGDFNETFFKEVLMDMFEIEDEDIANIRMRKVEE